MRKITSLLMLLCAFVGTAWAQTLDADHPYYLKVKGAELYIDIKNGVTETSGQTITISTIPVAAYFTASGEGWTISTEPGNTGNFLKVNRWCANPCMAESSVWTITESDGAYVLSQSEYQGGGDANVYLGNDSGANTSGAKLFTDQTIANAVKFTIVDADAMVDVTYTFTYGGVTKATQTTTAVVGEEFPAITVTFPMGVVAEKPIETVTKENANQTIELTVDESLLPFVAAESYETIEHWYYMNIRDDGPTYMYYDNSISYIKADKSAVDTNNKDIYTWGFIGNPFDGFSIVNYAAGSTMVLSAPVAPTENKNAEQLARMVAKEGATGNLVWTIMNPTHGGAPAGAFYVQHPTATAYAFNRQEYNSAQTLCYWDGRDTGSALQIIERPMGIVAELEALIAEAEDLYSTVNAHVGTKIGDYTQASADALYAAINAAKAIEDANITENDKTTLQAAMDAVAVVLPTVGKYYQLKSSLTGFAETKAVYSSGTGAGWKTLNADDKSFYWQAVATDDGGVAFVNANDGKYLVGNANQSGAWPVSDTYTAAAKMNVKPFAWGEGEANNEVGVILNNWQMHCAEHGGGNGTSGDIVSWDTNNANSASSWFVVEAELPTFYTVTYNFVYNEDVKYSTTTSIAANAAYPAVEVPALPYGVTTSATTPEGSVTENTVKEFVLTVEKELPFSTDTWYYAQMHANGNVTAYIQDTNEATNVDWNDHSVDATEIDAHLWKFVGDIWSGIKVINKATGRAIVSTSGAAVLGDAANATAFVPTNSQAGGNWFCLKYPTNNQYLNAQGNQAEGKGTVNAWTDNDNGSSFLLTEYKETEVVVSAADYATLYLGQATYIPEGVEVYIVAEAGAGSATLAPVEGGVLPANTGVILKNAGTYTFKTAGATATVEGNLLSGSVTDTYVEGTAYVLSNGAEGIGLYKAVLNKNAEGGEGTTHFLNNANKAYLPVTTGSQVLRFNFGETTGIENAIVGENGNAAIFDLSGRRVAKMQKGIYIVNGKKVYVK